MAASMTKPKHPLLLEFAVAIFTIIAYIVGLHEPILSSRTASTALTFTATHVRNFSFAETVNVLHSKHSPTFPPGRDRRCLAVLLILLAGDIQMNPGPENCSVFPCGTCDIPVTWSQEGVCCNNCSVWYHKSCEDLSSKNMSYLGRSSASWYCCKYDSINVDSFTFNSIEMCTSAIFTPAAEADTSLESVASSAFSPLHTRSTNFRPHQRDYQSSTGTSLNTSKVADSASKTEILHKSTNLKLLTVNCCGIPINKAEFCAA